MANEANKRMTGEPPESFYAATAVPHAPRARLMQDIDTGVCIVGGGFAGLWTARAFARRGYDVVVLEAETVAGQASGRNGGLVSAGYAARLSRIVERVGLEQAKSLYALSRQGMDIVGAALAEGIPGVDPVPGRLNVQRFDDLDGARRQADFLGENFGHEMLLWPTERVRETLKTERYYQALHDADAFSVHPYNLALALAAEIEQRGGRIFEQTLATGADLEGVRKWIETPSGRVRAQDVVFCGSTFIGPGFPALARAILPVSTYMCATEPIPEKLQENIRYAGAVADTRRAGDYYRIAGDRLLWGGRISTRTGAPRRLKRKLARDIARVYPALKGVIIDHAWSGVMGYAVHSMPQIGMLRPGAWVASGFGGHGLNTTAMAGELISTAIIDHDERWRQFIPFGLVWAGGSIGRRTTQLVYWSMKLGDKYDEAKAKFGEYRATRAAAAEAARKVAEAKAAEEMAARKKIEDAERRKAEQEELARLLALEEEKDKKRKEEAEKALEATKEAAKAAESAPEKADKETDKEKKDAKAAPPKKKKKSESGA
jgi:glycine/D-amino acid oxidase-like deaminating enzyme